MSLNPIAIVILAIVALVAAGVLLWQNWDTVKEKLLALWDKFKEMFGKVRDFAIEVWEKIKTFIPEALIRCHRLHTRALGQDSGYFVPCL